MRVPALVAPTGDVLIQSLAIIEYLDETHPEPPLLPKDPIARAQARALAEIVACDIHPLNNIGPLRYLKREMHQEQSADRRLVPSLGASPASRRSRRWFGPGPYACGGAGHDGRPLPGAAGLQCAAAEGAARQVPQDRRHRRRLPRSFPPSTAPARKTSRTRSQIGAADAARPYSHFGHHCIASSRHTRAQQVSGLHKMIKLLARSRPRSSACALSPLRPRSSRSRCHRPDPGQAAPFRCASCRSICRPPIRSACASKASWPCSTAAPPIPPAPTRSGATKTPIAKQQADLDRILAQAKRRGCEGGGFFALFTGQVAAMRAAQRADPADARQSRPHDERSRTYSRAAATTIRTDSGARSSGNWRKTIAARNIARQPRRRDRAAFSTRCSAARIINPGGDGAPSGTYRTVCVRTCDGYYFPISYSTVPNRFADDQRTCQRECPAAEALALHLSQSRRGHQPGGVDQRPAVYRAAERLSLSQRVHRRPARAGGRVRAGPMRSRTPTTRPRSRAATSS